MTDPLEIRNDPEDDGDSLDTAARAVEELRASVETFRRETSDQLERELRTLGERMAGVETRLNRPGATGGGDGGDGGDIERRAFTSFLRRGREAMAADEVRALRVADDTSGGFLAPAEFTTEVIKGIVEHSPIRQAARVGQTASGSVILPKRTGRPTARWVGETETRQETGSTYGQVEIPVHEMAAFVDVSQQLLEDSAVNVEAEVAADLAEEFGRLEGGAFVHGDGVKKPVGFMGDATIGHVLNGHSTTLKADALIRLQYDLPAGYRTRGVWLMNGTTLGVARTLTDGLGNFLWQPSFQAGQPETLLGRPVIEAVDMPDVASGEHPIVFGDFGTLYRIYDRVSLSILRDPFSVATSGLVRFHARRRVGGGVVLAEAVRKLKMATT